MDKGRKKERPLSLFSNLYMFLRNVKSMFRVKRIDIIDPMGSMGRDFERKESGRIGEGAAAEFLQRKGFKILIRNYRKPWGEIDIIAEKDDIVRFVEVKTLSFENIADVSRESGNSYRPEEQAHTWKLRKVARTAEMYMNSKGDSREYQVDVVGVLLDKKTRLARCRLFEQVL